MTRERLHKVLAHAGIASRRRAEQLIGAGRVKVNGELVTQLGTSVSPEDRIEVDGRAVGGAEASEYYLVHKPPGVVSTVRDPHRRPTVLSLLRGVRTRVYPVGRLDADSEGLLLLTNDGQLAHRLTHPRYGVEKEYLVQLGQPAGSLELDRIRQGIESQGERLSVRRIDSQGADTARVTVVLAEGKKREVRRMFEAVGARVVRLQRTRFGPLRLDDLPPGHYRPLTKEEIEQLRAATSG